MMFFGGIGLLLLVLFLGVLIAGGVWFIKTVSTSSSQTHSRNVFSAPASPREILDQRYARGEISREEYETVKHDLSD